MMKTKLEKLLKWAQAEYQISTGNHRHYYGGYVQSIRDIITIFEAYDLQSSEGKANAV